MSAAGSGAEAACKLSAIESFLGEVFWKLHIPNITYHHFKVGQKAILTQIHSKGRKYILPLKFFLWFACFFLTLYIISYYDHGATIAPLLVILALVIFLIGYNRAVHKALYDGCADRPSDFLIGEGGILHISHLDIRLFPWESISLHSKDEHGHYLIAENFTVLVLPEAALAQNPAASEIVAFIDQKMARPRSS